MINVVVSTRSKFPCPEGDYHYPKLQGARRLRSAFKKCSDITGIIDLIDTDRDLVGFDIKVTSEDVVTALVKRVLGDDHSLLIYNPYAPKS